MNVKVIDIETNNLLSELIDYSSFPYKLKEDARLWCVVVTDPFTLESKTAKNEEITKEWMKEVLKGADYIVQHNGIKFDLLMLKLFGVLDYEIGWLGDKDKVFGEDVMFIDTLILSRLFSPDRFGGHSLEVWGERLGERKTDFRKACIEAGVISPDSPKSAEFQVYSDVMLEYCIQDTVVGSKIFLHFIEEMKNYPDWKQASRMEHKLADLAIRRELLGFWFDKDLAVKCVQELEEIMEGLRQKVNPLLPPKPMNKTELNQWTPPKTQLKKDGTLASAILKFANRIGAEIEKMDDTFYLKYEGKAFSIPFSEPVKTTTEADISNLDFVKQYLVYLGWEPTEWAERDLTKDSKKQSLPMESRLKATDRWFKETMEGKYTKFRLEELKGTSVEDKYKNLVDRLGEQWPVRVLTSPKVRVGVEKELCPNLVKLGEKVAFAKDFAMYLTYKHRKSSIAGGVVEDMDFDEEVPNSGFLSMYREQDGRIPTPAIEIGANTSRYRHIGVCNIARASSTYGKEMRSLFGSGKGAVQFGFDYASLEARIQGHYCWNYTDGPELSETLLAEKPNDIHSVTGRKLGIPRSDAKSVNYMLMYGGSWVKAKKMLNLTDEEAKSLVDKFWDSMPALKELKEVLEAEWIANDKKYIKAIDGRKLNVRSKHSIINLLFQSGGVICAKYVSVFIMEQFEKMGLCIDPFKGKPDVCSMIEYHDEQQLFCNPKFFKFETFETEEEAEAFVKSWEGAQLSDISFGKKWYVTLPNTVSEVIEVSIKRMEKLLKLNVPLGYAYAVANNWYGCH